MFEKQSASMRSLLLLQTSRKLFLTKIHTCCSLCQTSTKKSDDHIVINIGSRSKKYKNEYREKKSRKKFEASSIFFLFLPATTFALGCWQVYRLNWKHNLILLINDRYHGEPIEFPINDLSNIDNYEYYKVRLKGRYIYDKQILIGPRKRIDKAVTNRPGTAAGFLVITPYKLDDSDAIILINRGWFPEKNAPSGPRESISLIGVIRKSETKGLFGNGNNPDENKWYYKDTNQMARICGTLPILVDADDESTIRGGPIGGQTNVKLKDDHLSYLLTWYSLTFATLVVWYKRFIR